MNFSELSDVRLRGKKMGLFYRHSKNGSFVELP